MSTLKRTKRQVRNWISRRPFLYLALARPSKGDFVVAPDTDVVVEGFPRSGNSYAEAALRVSANRPLKMAHHCHAAAQLHGAARWDIPALVVIREPLEACRSLLMHNTSLFEAKATLEEYIMFHEDIRPVRSAFVLAAFETVTSDFPSVLDALNRRFGTDYAHDGAAEFSDDAAFNMLDKTSLERGRVNSDGEPYSPRRSEAEKTKRETEKARVRAVFETPELAELVARARLIYNELLAGKDL